jgi:pimeloyl-ACP methyl ester carboxylesterase
VSAGLAATSPHLRVVGEGPAVLCLHSTGSSSRQWSSLAESLANRYRVISADLIAHGRNRPWAPAEAPSIDAELDALAPVVEAEQGAIHVVGHSYGGAVAIRLALRHPGRITTVSAFEPVMFRQLLEALPDHECAMEAVEVAGTIQRELAAGQPEVAAQSFYDYWSGEGAWERLGDDARRMITGRMPAASACFQALFADDTPRAALARLAVPTLLMSAGRSPASGRAATKLLAGTLPRAWWKCFPALGHMGPIEAPEVVNRAIARFLDTAHRRSLALRPHDSGSYPRWGVAAAA